MAKLRVDKIAAVGVSTETTGSVFFDGTDDHLAVADSDDFILGVGDFTIEFWMKPALEDTSAYDGDFSTILDHDADAGTSGAWFAIHQVDKKFRIAFDNVIKITTSDFLDIQSWHHVALTRSGNTFTVFGNGVDVGNTTDTHDLSDTSTRELTIGKQFFSTNNRLYNGYISNLRICKGHAVYTSNFAPPTRELEVHLETVLLCCHDGEDIFADKTGRHIIAALGDRTSSPTPTATDSPIGITTENPGLIRDVDNTFGPSFQGGAAYASQNWLTLPKGTTTERMPSFGGVQSGTRGVFAGAYTPTRDNKIEYITIPTTGNTTNFGQLNNANGGMAGFSDNTRGWAVGGNIAPTRTNVMEYVTISSTGNAIDGGDLITATQARPGSCSNSIRGIVAGGATPGQVKTIVHHTIQTTGIVQDFGDLTEAKQGVAGVMSPTRGVFAGGNTPTRVDTIEYITTASTGNAVLFGELSLDDRSNMGGASNTVRGLFGGGRTPSDLNHIEFITMATLGNAQDFGDLIQSGMDGDVGAVSSSTRVVFGGGSSDELGYVEIATLGNTTAFGNFTVSTTANQDPACFSNGHGGLG